MPGADNQHENPNAMSNAQKIAALLGAIGYQVSRIEFVRAVFVSKNDDLRRFAVPAEEVLEKALQDIARVAEGIADFMNETDMADENDVAILSPVFDLMKDYPYEDE